MAQLTKGMYVDEFRSESKLFGLFCGQMCSGGKITHKSSWYNKAGEKLGWGDLSIDNIRRVASELEEGELFIILGERDSLLNFVEQVGPGSMDKTKPTAEAPGVDYVVEKCSYIIGKGVFYYVDRDFGHSMHMGTDHSGVIFTVINPAKAKVLIETSKS